MTKLVTVLASLLLAGCQSTQMGTDIGCPPEIYKSRWITVEGFIDAETVAKVRQNIHAIDGIILDSSGGYVYDALLIAELVYDNDIKVMIDGECDSACGFVYGASKQRFTVNGELVGLHCPYYEYEDEEQQCVNAQSETYWYIKHVLKFGLGKRTAEEWIEIMQDTQPNEMSYVVDHHALDLMGSCNVIR